MCLLFSSATKDGNIRPFEALNGVLRLHPLASASSEILTTVITIATSNANAATISTTAIDVVVPSCDEECFMLVNHKKAIWFRNFC